MKKLKLLITDKVREKSVSFCELAQNLEWSGISFYRIENYPYNNELRFIIEDLLLMDIGSEAFTSYEENERVPLYIMKNNLINCMTGHFHSHNIMQTTFSSTDINTIKTKTKEKYEDGIFLSVITNIREEYNAKIGILNEVEIQDKLTKQNINKKIIDIYNVEVINNKPEINSEIISEWEEVKNLKIDNEEKQYNFNRFSSLFNN